MLSPKLGLVALVLVTGCVPLPSAREPTAVGRVQILTEAEGAQQTLPRSKVSMQFGPRGGGDQLVAGFMEHAHRLGAAYASGIEVHEIGVVGSQLLDCVSAIGPIEELRQRTRLQTTPGRTISRMVFRPVSHTETHTQTRCSMVSHPVTRTRTAYSYQYNAASKTSRTVPRTETYTAYEQRNECRQVPVTSTTTRMESRWVTDYIPPKTIALASQYSTWTLAESEPVCRPIAPSDARQNHITAIVFGAAR